MSSFAMPGQRSRPSGGSASQIDDDDDADVSVVGYSCNVYRDDAAAVAIDAGEHLLLWMDNKQEDLWIDRYDCRLLLDDLSAFNRKTSSPVISLQDEEMEKILDSERYRFLPSESEQNAQEEAAEQDEPQRSSDAQYGQVHFSFDQPQNQQQQQQSQQGPSADTPQEILDLAAQLGMRSDCSLPRTRKQHQAIEKTAKFVLKQGQKMEAMLKVKHGGNPAFAFLLVDNPLQPYYQALVAHFRSNPAAAELPTILPDPPQGQAEGSTVAAGEAEKEQEATPGAAIARDEGREGETGERAASHATVSAQATKIEGEGSVTNAGAAASASQSVEAKQQGEQPEGQVVQGERRDGESRARPVSPDDPEMLKAVEKLVQWVLKSGRQFEEKVRDRQRGDRRFDFLLPWNRYNAYYRWRLEEAERDREAGGGVEERQEEQPEAKEAAGQEGLTAEEGQEKGAAVGEKQQSTEAEHVYDPHAITTVEAITSFGGSESEEEQEQVEEAKPSSDATQSSDGKSGTESQEDKGTAQNDEPAASNGAGVAEEADGAEELRKAEAVKEAVKAARLQRAKLLAEKLEGDDGKGGKGEKTEESKRRSRSRSDSPRRRRSRSRGRTDSRDRGRDRSRPRDRDRREERRGESKLSRRSRSRSRSRSRGRMRRRSRSRSRTRSRSRDRRKERDRSRSRERKRKERRRKRRRRSGSRSRSRSRSSRRSPSPRRSLSPKRRKKDDGDAKSQGAGSAAAAGGDEQVVVSDALRDKVRAMLAGKV